MQLCDIDFGMKRWHLSHCSYQLISVKLVTILCCPLVPSVTIYSKKGQQQIVTKSD